MLEGQTGAQGSRRRAEVGETGEGGKEGLVNSGVFDSLSKSSGELLQGFI